MEIIGTLFLTSIAGGGIICIILLIRNFAVFRFRTRVADRFVFAGHDPDWMLRVKWWRQQPDYDAMVFKFWKRLPDFLDGEYADAAKRAIGAAKE